MDDGSCQRADRTSELSVLLPPLDRPIHFLTQQLQVPGEV